MAGFAIMRMKKIKSAAALVGSLKHDTREWMPKNADPKRLSENDYTASTEQALSKYTHLLPEKVRKNAVHAVEIVLTASPEWFDSASEKKVHEFGMRSRKWLHEVFGKENELLCALHKDEKTPHFHAVFMPLVDGNLNAKSLIGGSRNRMRELQDDFYAKVGQPLGMTRGVRNEAVRHTEPKEYARLLAGVERREKAVKEQEKALEKAMELWKGKLPGKDFDTGIYLGNVFHSLSPDQIKDCWAVTKAHADKLREQNQKAPILEKEVSNEKRRARSK